MNHVDSTYITKLDHLIHYGDRRNGRNGGVRSLFGTQMEFDLRKGFPLLTTKKVHFKSILVELLWFIKGMTNVDYLHKHGVTIWDEWADENGDLGPVYGKQWRDWNGIDQLNNLIEGIKNDPFGRRHIISAWNPEEIEDMALPPCHCLFQFHVTTDGYLNCKLYQRSADWFLGVPFNIASYALLTHLIARETGLAPGKFYHTFGDYHIYENHIDAANIQLGNSGHFDLPSLRIKADHTVSIFDLEPEHIALVNYKSDPAIPAPVSK